VAHQPIDVQGSNVRGHAVFDLEGVPSPCALDFNRGVLLARVEADPCMGHTILLAN
jgi:hypothetical protein